MTGRAVRINGLPPIPTLTAFDRDAIAIVYQRMPRSTAPDNDPPDFVANAPASGLR